MSTVSNIPHAETREGSGLRLIIIRTVSLIPLGSVGDRVGLIVTALVLTTEGFCPSFRAVARKSPLLTCAAYSAIAIASAWANCRYRLGGGPFHLALAGGWRGYPLPYEEMGLTSHGTVWWEFHSSGVLVDSVLVVLGYLLIARFIGVSAAPFWLVMLSIYSALFVWLNIEFWLFDAPILFSEWPRAIYEGLRQPQAVTRGFPFVYLRAGSPLRKWALPSNIILGGVGWLSLYCLLRWARREQRC
jgi:hypothetical protein